MVYESGKRTCLNGIMRYQKLVQNRTLRTTKCARTALPSSFTASERLKRASVAEARAAIFGYTCVNDVTARDVQRAEVQFTRAKSFDTFCPCGPWIETELDPTKLRVTAHVNDECRQDGNTEQMTHPVAELISFMSHAMTLEAGDLIPTGTPKGVGPLTDGDVVRIGVEGIGDLQNPVRAGE